MTMQRHIAAFVLIVITLVLASATLAQQPTATPARSQPALDPNDPIARIREEGLKRSQVMGT